MPRVGKERALSREAVYAAKRAGRDRVCAYAAPELTLAGSFEVTAPDQKPEATDEGEGETR
jgi:hypothetical protein